MIVGMNASDVSTPAAMRGTFTYMLQPHHVHRAL